MRRWLTAATIALLVVSTQPQVSAASRSGIPNDAADAAGQQAPAPVFLRLKAGDFDLTRQPRGDETVAVGARGLYVVQFRDRIGPAVHEALAKAGVEPGPFLPDQALAVRMTADQARALAGNPLVLAVVHFRPEWKVAPELARAKDPDLDVAIMPFPGAEVNALAGVRAMKGARVGSTGNMIVGRLARAQLPNLLRREDVLWVESVSKNELSNDVASGLMRVTETRSDRGERQEGVRAYGLTGQGQVLGIMDTGLDTGDTSDTDNSDGTTSIHADFQNRIRAGFRWAPTGVPGQAVFVPGAPWEDTNGHGTHTAGSAVGSGDRSPAGQNFSGTAPEANLVVQSAGPTDEGIPRDLTGVLDQARGQGATIHTDSWGHRGAYDLGASAVDQYLWNHRDFTVLFSAGNQGDAAGTVISPGLAKNVITVGASKTSRTDRPGTLAGNPAEMAPSSSRGPTPDGRFKPDVVAPGTWILSTKSSFTATRTVDAIYGSGPYINDDYEYLSGTSMATPLTAGSVALLREYLQDVRHIFTPSASLIKATLINGAVDLGSRWSVNDQGWGRVNLVNSLYPEGGRINWYENESHSLSTGDSQTYDFWVDSGQSAKVTLVWTDMWAAPNPTRVLVNDLDLSVTGPDGKVYRGNCFDTGRDALENCPVREADHVNNVENVFIPTPQSGLYRVTVSGYQVATAMPQPYSLVVSGKHLATGANGNVTCTAGAAGLPGPTAPDGLAGTPTPASGVKPDASNKDAMKGYVPPDAQPAGQKFLQSVMEVRNNCAAVNIGDNGRFNFGLLRPTTNTWYNTSYSWPSSPGTSFTTVRIDGSNYIYGSSGGFVQAPHNETGTRNAALWRAGEISVRQTISIAQNPSTSQADAAQIRYTITNAGTSAHDVGLRMMIDTMLNRNDGAPFRIPSLTGLESVVTERDYSSSIPDFWQAFNDLNQPDISAQFTLRGADATPPDRLAIAYWGSIVGTSWDYTVTPGRAVTGDSAVGMWWNPVRLEPGETRTIITYYGRPRVTRTQALTLSCPTSLAQREWSTHPFNIAAYFTNNTAAAYPGVVLDVDTQLSKVDNDPSHRAGDVPGGGSAQTTWRLQPSTADTYNVRVNAWETLPNGHRLLIQFADCQVQALPPPIPDGVSLGNSAGTNADGIPLAVRCRPLTVDAHYPAARTVLLSARDAAGHSYSAAMTKSDPENWTHTFTPCSVGLTASPITVELHVRYPHDPDEYVNRFQVILIDPSGTVYNQSQGVAWTLPDARVLLQYYDPALAAWVNLTDAAYPGRFTPVDNPQWTGSDGRYAWDVAAGQYRVQVSRPGFQNATSSPVTIPPAVTDLNIGLVPTDTTPPTVSYSGVTDGATYTEPVTVQLPAADTGGAGVRSLTYTLDDGSPVTVTGDQALVTVSASGNHTIRYQAVDHAGNASAAGQVSFTIGCTTGPALSWLPPLVGGTPGDADASQPFTISFQYQQCGRHLHDESVTIRVRDAVTGELIVGWTYGADIVIDDIRGEYSQAFVPFDYVDPGTTLNVLVYFGGQLAGTSQVHVR